ncbi:hypothetical protein [Tessaracoccus coleopterorum]|uniref:hypothetical protein n=1 Tax=Tessaracoccus coleopterorum TaxID=2714950 RepID=UPI001E2E53C9|nr:hypothetical protein [Tessaracoccus coleopterorum]
MRDSYRVAWRAMADGSGVRTLFPAIIPPGATHVHGVNSASPAVERFLPIVAGAMSSILNDLAIRISQKSALTIDSVRRLYAPDPYHPLVPRLILRVLRLTCLTDAYAALWEDAWDEGFINDEWLLGKTHPGAPVLGDVGPHWTASTPLRRDLDRRNALVEIDALMATMLGVTADELSTIYRTQFPVLYGYDQNDYIYDANGRLVPTQVRQLWRKKGDKLTVQERTATHPAGTIYAYELPFAPETARPTSALRCRGSPARLIDG